MRFLRNSTPLALASDCNCLFQENGNIGVYAVRWHIATAGCRCGSVFMRRTRWPSPKQKSKSKYCHFHSQMWRPPPVHSCHRRRCANWRCRRNRMGKCYATQRRIPIFHLLAKPEPRSAYTHIHLPKSWESEREPERTHTNSPSGKCCCSRIRALFDVVSLRCSYGRSLPHWNTTECRSPTSILGVCKQSRAHSAHRSIRIRRALLCMCVCVREYVLAAVCMNYLCETGPVLKHLPSWRHDVSTPKRITIA